MRANVRPMIWIVMLMFLQSAYGQSELTPKRMAEGQMKDPEVIRITNKWMRDNPGKLVVSLDAACNGTNTYFIEFTASKEALFHTRTVMWLEVDPQTSEFGVPHVGVVTTNTTTSPSKKLRFTVSLPRSKRDAEAVVEIKELRTFTIDGQTTVDGMPAVDILFSGGREPELSRYHLRVKDFGFDESGALKFIGEKGDTKR